MPRRLRGTKVNHFDMSKTGMDSSNLPYTKLTSAFSDSGTSVEKSTLPIESWKKVSAPLNAVSKWQNYVSSRRKIIKQKAANVTASFREGPAPRGEYRRKDTIENLNSTLKGIDSDLNEDEEEKTYGQGNSFVTDITPSFEEKSIDTRSGKSMLNSRTLIYYFSKLATSPRMEDMVDLDFVEGLIDNGADINISDKHGQTIFHEVARAWHIDVAKFLIEKNADVNKADKFGRSPLHVASAVNYSEMVEFLCHNGADIHAKTCKENQTPMHYAAKNDAINSLKMLMNLNADPNSRDFKNRTPLQVAAELDRSETTKYLIEQGVPVGVCDSSGLPALTLMIQKMPLVAREALQQFHSTDRANRKQYFYLNYLETKKPGEERSYAKLPMECTLEFKHLDLIMHPVFRKLIDVKWRRFGKMRCLLQVALHVIFVVIWTIVGVSLPRDYKYYEPIKERWWNVTLESIVVLWTLYFIFLELWEYKTSSNANKKWKKWRKSELEKDMQFFHPRWPEERKYILQELEMVENSTISYFKDAWNYFDWITYAWIMTVILSRIVAVFSPKSRAGSLHARFMAVALIFIWLRLMKVLRTFEALGPFIVMIGHIVDDTLKFLFVYFLLFVPYVCAFWIIFGGSSNAAIMKKASQPTTSWEKFNDLVYTVSQITVVGDFAFDSITAVDRLTAQLLVGTFIALSGIVMINLFIALMSDTFQRVYDNAKANAVMQRAAAIQDVEARMGRSNINSFRRFIHTNCCPLVAYYDDDDTSEGGELEKMTIQIKEVVDDIDENIKEALKEGGVTKSIEEEFTTVKDLTLDAIKKQDRKLRQMDRKLEELSVLMNELLNRTTLDPNRLANLPPPSALSRNFDAKKKSTEAPPQEERLRTEEQVGRNSKRLKARKSKNASSS